MHQQQNLILVVTLCLVESYKKKTKVELQRSIKSLKDDNAMFTNLNQDLRRILTGVSRVHAK